jgi:hypothetical protein
LSPTAGSEPRLAAAAANVTSVLLAVMTYGQAISQLEIPGEPV